MKRFAFLAAVVLAALAAAPVAGAAGSSGVARVVGSGPIAWPQIAVRTRPSLTAPVVATLAQFRPDYRPRVVLALDQRLHPVTGAALWYRISIPGRPNGRTGWVPAAAVTVRPADRRLVIDRSSRTFRFYLRGKMVRSGKVAVGARGMETPLGLFHVQAKFDPTWPVLGAYAFETSAYSKLSEWPGGGVVGVHGTNTPESLGQAVSHGCVRLANADIQFLRSVVPVGTPVEIVA